MRHDKDVKREDEDYEILNVNVAAGAVNEASRDSGGSNCEQVISEHYE